VKPTILLVDDDSAILRFVGAVLSRDNFNVTTASSAAEALPYIARDDFDIVLTDFWMPGETGEAVVMAIRQRPRRTPVILMTGQRNEIPERLRQGPGGIPILDKPFTVGDLREAIAKRMGIADKPS
jgi:DNA-binding NtrC family response regulator